MHVSDVNFSLPHLLILYKFKCVVYEGMQNVFTLLVCLCDNLYTLRALFNYSFIFR